MRSLCRRLMAEQGKELGLVMIDYLQLMEGSGSDNRVQELSRISDPNLVSACTAGDQGEQTFELMGQLVRIPNITGIEPSDKRRLDHIQQRVAGDRATAVDFGPH